MTSRQLEELLADAAAGAPVTAVTAAGAYRKGRRRRTLLRAGTAGAVAVALAVAGFGLTRIVGAEPQTQYPAEPRRVLDPLPATPTTCTGLAEAVRDVAEATLPGDYEWTGIRLNEGYEDCATGGLFWVTFTHEGREHTLGFEGGPQAEGGVPCDPARAVTKCVEDGTTKIGQYTAADDYGVLLGRDGLFFFLGLEDGADPAMTPDQLTEVARQIVRVIYRE